MIRSLLRMLKHITLAMLAIVSAVCIAEVSLRGYQLYQHCEGTGACELSPRPCPISFHSLPPLLEFTRADRGSGTEVAIRTNRLGLRGPDVVTPKPPELIRIVCLGDDATFAADVSEDSTFAALVQQELSRQSGAPVEVINAGVPGYCPLLSLAWARRQLVGLQPDLVVLCCDRSDVADDRRVRPLACYADDGTLEAVCHPAATRQTHNLLQAVEQEFQLAALLSRRLSASLDDGAADFSAAWDDAEASTGSDALQIRQTWEPIAALRDLCDQMSADFVVAFVPSRPEQTAAKQTEDRLLQLLTEETDEAGVPYLDVSADFPPDADPPLFHAQTGMMSADGHRRFAELLSWAILHRNGDAARSDESQAVVTPASATGQDERTSPVRPLPARVDEPAGSSHPTPLPNPRRPRGEDETPSWAQ